MSSCGDIEEEANVQDSDTKLSKKNIPNTLKKTAVDF